MKNSTFGIRAVFLTLAAVLACVVNPAFALLALLSVNPFTLCTTMSNANSATAATYVSANTNAKEQGWVDGIAFAGLGQSTWSDGSMMGGMNSGKVIEDHTKSKTISGTTIHISVGAQLGGPGLQGDTQDRIGTQEIVKQNSFDLVTGSWFASLAQTTQAGEETHTGAAIDLVAADLLATRVKVKVESDIEMTIVGAGTSARNQQFQNNKTYDTLMTADTLTWSTITRGANRLVGLNAKAVKITTAQPGYEIKRFMWVGPREVISPLRQEATYQAVQQYAGPRDSTNVLFKGGYTDVEGQIIYSQDVLAGDRNGSIGSAFQPDAFLGIAVAADNTFNAGVIRGGGNATAAAEVPLKEFFEFFRLFTYTKMNGETVSTGSTTAYAAIINSTDGTVTPFSYTANTGNSLTGCIRLSLTAAGNQAATLGSGIGSGGMTASSAAYNAVTAPWTTATAGNKGPLSATATAIPAGSLIVQTNKAGVPVGYVAGVGGRALCWGWGRGVAGNIDGERIFETLQLKRDKVWGVRIRGGVTAAKDTNQTVNGIVLITCARQVPGMPDVAYA